MLVAGYGDRAAAVAAAVFLGGDATVVAVGDDGWADAWRAHAQPTVVGDVAVVPAWCPEPADVAHVVVIEPGRSFGVGNHPSTRLVVAALQRSDLDGASVLDVGTGTGVLAVTAARLGATRVVAVDTDADARRVARHNVEVNEVGATVTVTDGELSAVGGTFDVVVANILPATLVSLADDLVARVAAGGRLVLSGIPTSEVDRVLVAHHADEIARLELDGWSAPVLSPGAV